MKKIEESPGKHYNGWTALDFAFKKERGELFWRYSCKCGTVRPVSVSRVQSGRSKDCGCGRKNTLATAAKVHGMTKHPMYATWHGMKTRCTNPNHKNWDIYGGKGVTVCPKWISFAGFLEDMGDSWKPGLSIERIDSDGNYEKSNCCWATAVEQANNRRSNVKVMCPDGVVRNAKIAAGLFGIPHKTFAARIRRGVPESEWFRAVVGYGPRKSTEPKGDAQ